VPEAEDAQACRDRPDQSAGKQALIGSLRHGRTHAIGEACARPEVSLEKQVAREKKQGAGEAAESCYASCAVGLFVSHGAAN
jgi:hypothetical protein